MSVLTFIMGLCTPKLKPTATKAELPSLLTKAIKLKSSPTFEVTVLSGDSVPKSPSVRRVKHAVLACKTTARGSSYSLSQNLSLIPPECLNPLEEALFYFPLDDTVPLLVTTRPRVGKPAVRVHYPQCACPVRSVMSCPPCNGGPNPLDELVSILLARHTALYGATWQLSDFAGSPQIHALLNRHLADYFKARSRAQQTTPYDIPGDQRHLLFGLGMENPEPDAPRCKHGLHKGIEEGDLGTTGRLYLPPDNYGLISVKDSKLHLLPTPGSVQSPVYQAKDVTRYPGRCIKDTTFAHHPVHLLHDVSSEVTPHELVERLDAQNPEGHLLITGVNPAEVLDCVRTFEPSSHTIEYDGDGFNFIFTDSESEAYFTSISTTRAWLRTSSVTASSGRVYNVTLLNYRLGHCVWHIASCDAAPQESRTFPTYSMVRVPALVSGSGRDEYLPAKLLTNVMEFVSRTPDLSTRNCAAKVTQVANGVNPKTVARERWVATHIMQQMAPIKTTGYILRRAFWSSLYLVSFQWHMLRQMPDMFEFIDERKRCRTVHPTPGGGWSESVKLRVVREAIPNNPSMLERMSAFTASVFVYWLPKALLGEVLVNGVMHVSWFKHLSTLLKLAELSVPRVALTVGIAIGASIVPGGIIKFVNRLAGHFWRQLWMPAWFRDVFELLVTELTGAPGHRLLRNLPGRGWAWQCYIWLVAAYTILPGLPLMGLFPWYFTVASNWYLLPVFALAILVEQLFALWFVGDYWNSTHRYCFLAPLYRFEDMLVDPLGCLVYPVMSDVLYNATVAARQLGTTVYNAIVWCNHHVGSRGNCQRVNGLPPMPPAVKRVVKSRNVDRVLPKLLTVQAFIPTGGTLGAVGVDPQGLNFTDWLAQVQAGYAVDPTMFPALTPGQSCFWDCVSSLGGTAHMWYSWYMAFTNKVPDPGAQVVGNVTWSDMTKFAAASHIGMHIQGVGMNDLIQPGATDRPLLRLAISRTANGTQLHASLANFQMPVDRSAAFARVICTLENARRGWYNDILARHNNAPANSSVHPTPLLLGYLGVHPSPASYQEVADAIAAAVTIAPIQAANLEGFALNRQALPFGFPALINYGPAMENARVAATPFHTMWTRFRSPDNPGTYRIRSTGVIANAVDRAKIGGHPPAPTVEDVEDVEYNDRASASAGPEAPLFRVRCQANTPSPTETAITSSGEEHFSTFVSWIHELEDPTTRKYVIPSRRTTECEGPGTDDMSYLAPTERVEDVDRPPFVEPQTHPAKYMHPAKRAVAERERLQRIAKAKSRNIGATVAQSRDNRNRNNPTPAPPMWTVLRRELEAELVPYKEMVLPEMPLEAETIRYVPDLARASRLLADLKANPLVLGPLATPLLLQSLDAVLDLYKSAVPLPEVEIVCYLGIWGCGKTTATIEELNTLSPEDLANVRVVSHSESLRAQNKVNLDYDPFRGYNLPTLSSLILEPSTGDIVWDDAGRYFGGALDLVILTNPLARRHIINGDPAQTCAKFPVPGTQSRNDLSPIQVVAGRTTKYATLGHRGFRLLSNTMGTYTTNSTPGHITHTVSGKVGIPVTTASPRYVEVLTNGGREAYTFDKVQGEDFKTDVEVDMTGLESAVADATAYVALTRSNCGVYMHLAAANPTSVVREPPTGSNLINALVYSMRSTNTNRLTRPDWLVKAAFYRHLHWCMPSLPWFATVGATVDASEFQNVMAVANDRAVVDRPIDDVSPVDYAMPSTAHWEDDVYETHEVDKYHREIKGQFGTTDQFKECAFVMPHVHKRNDDATYRMSLDARLTPSTVERNRRRMEANRRKDMCDEFDRLVPVVPQWSAEKHGIYTSRSIGEYASSRTSRQVMAKLDSWDPDRADTDVKISMKPQTIKKAEKRNKLLAVPAQMIHEFDAAATFNDAPYALFLEDEVIPAFPENFLFYRRFSPRQFAEEYRRRWRVGNGAHSSDVTRWDVGCDAAVLNFDCHVMSRAGLPNDYVESYRERRLASKSQHGLMATMQNSGDRYTWTLNTIRRAVVTSLVLGITPNDTCAVNGDDAAVDRECSSAEFPDSPWEFKNDNGRLVEFSGFQLGGPEAEYSATGIHYRALILKGTNQHRNSLDAQRKWASYLDLLGYADCNDWMALDVARLAQLGMSETAFSQSLPQPLRVHFPDVNFELTQHTHLP